jgi:hypothetical protein
MEIRNNPFTTATWPAAAPVPPAPAPSPGGTDWGNGLRDLSQLGLKKGVDEARKKTIWKSSDSSNNDHSTSLGNVGGEKLPGNLNSLSDRKGTNVAQFDWNLFRFGDFDVHDSGDWGSYSAKGGIDLMKVSGRAYYNVGLDDWTLKAGFGVQGRVDLVNVHYEGEYDTPSIYNLGGHDINLKTKLAADAAVGVNGFAEAEVGIGKNTHVDLGAGGFDGASASLKGSEDLGDFGGVNGDVTVWAGVGAKVDVDAGFKDGKFTFNFGAGLALGLGADYDWGFSIDFGNIADSLYNFGADASDTIQDIGDWCGGAAEDTADWIGGAAQDIGDGAKDVAGDIVDGAEDVVDGAGSVVEDVGDFLGF